MFWLPHPFLRYTGLLAAGIVGCTLADWYHPVLWILLLGCAMVLLRAQMGLGLNRGWTEVPASVFLVLAGWLLTYHRTEKHDSSHFRYAEKPIKAYGAVISSAVEEKARSFRFTLQVKAIRTESGWEPRSGRVQTYADKHQIGTLRHGAEVIVTGPPQPLAGPRNPEEFDYRKYLSRQSIYHSHYLPAHGLQPIGYQPPWALTAVALRLNRYADSVLTHAIGSRREYAVVKAMLLGARDDLEPELLRAYAASGAIHVLSISGMHVGIFFLALISLVGGYRRRIGRVPAWTEAALILLLIWGYAILTGLSTPVLRSALMVSFLTIGRAARRHSSPINTLALAAFVSLCLDPNALFQVGFQLSYLAVGGIICLQPRIASLLAPDSAVAYWLWQGTATALAAQLATFPVSVFYFHQFPTYFLLVNPVVLALSTGILYLGMAFLALCWWSQAGYWIGYGLGKLAWVLNEAIFLVEQFPYAIWGNLNLNGLELIAISTLLISGLLLLEFRSKRYLWLSIGCALVWAGSNLTSSQEQRNQRMLVVHHLGRQSGISLVTGRHLILLGDSAVRTAPQSASFQLAKFWTVAGIKTIDATGSNVPFRSNVFGEVVSWQGIILLWLNRPIRYTTVANKSQWVDVLLVSHNAHRYPEDILPFLSVKQLILDASNSYRTSARWKAAAKRRGIPCHDVREQGAFVRHW